MTLVCAWIRKNKNSEELIVASDTRLSGGAIIWDCCPKIFPLDRGDSVLAFAGDTHYAYPVALQLNSMINMHPKTRSRAMDITEIRHSIINLLNKMLGLRVLEADGLEHPKTQFLLAGYSWRYSKFMCWRIRYSPAINNFEMGRPKRSKFGVDIRKSFIFIGDKSHSAYSEAMTILDAKYDRNAADYIDMEPMDALKNRISNPDIREIGGTVQLVKIYKHLNCLPHNVVWPSKNSAVSLFGRPLLSHEKNNYLTIDMDTYIVTDPYGREIRIRTTN